MISFIIATVNRPALLRRCLESVVVQEGCFEIIVIDQSDKQLAFREEIAGVNVVHMARLGLSAARNRGVRESRGDIIAFIDDDAFTQSKYCKVLSSYMYQNEDVDAIAGRVLIEGTERPYAKTQHRPARRLRRIDWMTMLGGNMAFRRSCLDAVGPFDERLGAGARWASGEESDYFFNMMNHGICVVYLPDLVVYHPAEIIGNTAATLSDKLGQYGRGNGALFAKHFRRGSPMMFCYWLWSLFKPSARIVQYFLSRNVAQRGMYAAILRGRILGFFEYHE